MRHWIKGLALILLGIVLPAHGDQVGQVSQGIFYQPQLRDAALGEARWDEIVAQVKREGFDTLVVQWSRYGDAFAKPEESDWLAARLQRARSAGLRLVMGLYADPAFFQRQDQSAGSLARYLDQQERHNLRLAKEWRKRLGEESIAGWYLPAELDDLNWREPQRQALLASHLASSVNSLRELAPVPVYASTFFTGKMSPQAYQAFLSRLAGAGVSLVVQDGSGTGVLSQPERELYLSALAPCAGRMSGLIHELFVQQAGGTTFRAEPLDEAQQRALWAAPVRCGSLRWFFSLRYLPGLSDMR
ncbi:DUF4434 domain-containing protein [Aeromonas enteropelogenes]|uniref:DUF4434 domain-containing protein n=1 Tax=Aeromonas enteropelogenes TaxID=29489 RepID=UPI001CBB9CED|nr:DUF4434 domain-containing protein [Aeromonas enteropelogenes]UAK72851.1 DUF4434 domain-containing protein [Aeromonas enteropelogenes]